MYACVYIYICIHRCLYVYVYIYIYTCAPASRRLARPFCRPQNCRRTDRAKLVPLLLVPSTVTGQPVDLIAEWLPLQRILSWRRFTSLRSSRRTSGGTGLQDFGNLHSCSSRLENQELANMLDELEGQRSSNQAPDVLTDPEVAQENLQDTVTLANQHSALTRSYAYRSINSSAF